MPTDVNHTPSEELLKEVRVCLLIKGESFASYCQRRGHIRQNAAAALIGKWNGPKAADLVGRILVDLGIER